MVKPQAEGEVEENNNTKSMSDEEIKKIVDSAIAQNPLVYRRLADM
jgi:Asp-tRNA(Asn)/Glu-tRNA(Gln) amidotransferase B subunit